MKKLLLSIALLSSCAALSAQGISTAKDFVAFAEACNKGADISQWYGADSTVVLTADLDFSKIRKPVRVDNFTGRFDGKGFRIKGWKSDGGLFRTVARGAMVCGIVIDPSCALKINSKAGEFHAGFIADTNDGTIRDCVNGGSITHTCSYAMDPLFIGGIAGVNSFVILGCRNEGKIFSDVAGDAKEAVALYLGGICGGAIGKLATGCTISRCVNSGEVSVVSSLAAVYMGGIAGNPVRTTIKYCINRGEVKGDMRATEDGKTNGVLRIGGIAGQTKADILRSDNFGHVLAEGVYGANIGGVVGMPHEALVVADCLNYGKVEALGEQPSQAGGIAGNIGRPVHVRGCVNWGEVRFDGISSRNRSTAGGIVGNIYVVKSATAGTYVRDCVNHGSIYAGAGGNKYDANNRNAIHAAGVVAYAEGRQDLLAFVVDCSNDGPVTCVSGRKGSICATAATIATGGTAPDDQAVPMEAVAGQPNVRGSVLTPDGKPIEGVVVTDGRQCVHTAADGSYAMTSDLSETRFVYLSLPANVEIPTLDGVPAFFKRVPRYVKAVRADFVLTPRESAKDYTVLMIADPQVRPYGVDNSMEAWATTVSTDAEAFRASCKGDVYSINLGDLVYNFMYAWDDYMDAAKQIKCPTFNVIGNHDYDQATLFETELGNIYYETYVGPDHYSFDLGDVHYVILNTILYDRKGPGDSYSYGLDDRQMEWLEADLAGIGTDRTLVVCSHAQLFKNPNTSPHGSHGAYHRNYARYLSLLSKYKAVYSWNGHYHRNFYYNYAGKTVKHGAPNIQCISVTRCTGALRLNEPIGAMGEPQGYMVMEVKGDSLDWYYKSVGHDRDYQMRAYPPSRTSDGTVMVNVFNWSEGWTTPQWCEDGKPAVEMEYAPGVDPDYYDIFEKVTNKTTRKYCTPSKDSFLFKVKPSSGVTEGEIRVTDLFGHSYTQTVKW